MNIEGFDPYDFSRAEIQGVPVYYKNLPWSPCVHIRLLLSTGALADPVGKEGLAHFLEHIIGNGSPSLPDKKAVREFSRLYMLSSRNALTSHYWTAYVGKCLPEHLSTVLKKMTEITFNPLIRKEDVEHERKVITQEAWKRYRNAKFENFAKEFTKNAYSGHERERAASPLGWPETISEITQEDLNDFHKQNYVKENFSLLLVGAIDKKDLEILEEILKEIPSGKKFEKSYGKIGKPDKLRLEKTGEEIGYPREQAEFSILRTSNKIDDLNEEIMD